MERATGRPERRWGEGIVGDLALGQRLFQIRARWLKLCLRAVETECHQRGLKASLTPKLG
jgi:hypothetical protein